MHGCIGRCLQQNNWQLTQTNQRSETCFVRQCRRARERRADLLWWVGWSCPVQGRENKIWLSAYAKSFMNGIYFRVRRRKSNFIESMECVKQWPLMWFLKLVCGDPYARRCPGNNHAHRDCWWWCLRHALLLAKLVASGSDYMSSCFLLECIDSLRVFLENMTTRCSEASQDLGMV